jgi:choline dehydrogenase
VAEQAGRFVPESRARIIGGCSAHNQCAIVRPSPEDCTDWGWEAGDLVEVGREIDRRVPTTPYADENLASWQRAFLEAAVAAGICRVADVGDPAGPDGVAPFHANVRADVRWNAAFAFLDPVRGHPNVTVLSDTLVDRLEIEAGRAVTLSCLWGDRVLEIAARLFVLCAGTYGSPAILLRSGVGPKRDLGALGIPLRVERAGVGLNLHDHPGVALEYQPSGAARAVVAVELAERRLYQSQVLLRARSSSAGERADIHVAPYQAPTESGDWQSHLLVFNLAPRSRGLITLRGRDPRLPPRIELRLLTDPSHRDVAVLVEGLRLARHIAGNAPIAQAIAREVAPGASADTDAALCEFINASVTDYAHPVGTCAAGPGSDPSAVVGADGRLHGLDNVFVADASVMRQIPRANTNFACFLIGWRTGRRLAAAAL